MTPTYRIVIDEQDKTAVFKDRLLSLDITDNDGGTADTLSFKLDDRDWRLPLPAYEEIIKIWLGYEETGLVYMGRFAVNETETRLGNRELSIKAKAADMTSTLKEPRTRAWHDTSLSDIAETIAAEHGLQAKLHDDIYKITFQHINQSEESNMNLLTRLSREQDVLLKLVNGHLVMTPKGCGLSVSGQSIDFGSIDYSQVLSGSIRVSGRTKYGGVRCRWRNIISAETEMVSVGQSEPWYEIREMATDEVSAQRLATAKRNQLQRGEMSLDLSLQGNAQLQAGAVVKLGDGFKPDYHDSSWTLKTIRHSLNNAGYRTSITGELTGL